MIHNKVYPFVLINTLLWRRTNRWCLCNCWLEIWVDNCRTILMVIANCRFIWKIMNTHFSPLPVAVESCVQPLVWRKHIILRTLTGVEWFNTIYNHESNWIINYMNPNVHSCHTTLCTRDILTFLISSRFEKSYFNISYMQWN